MIRWKHTGGLVCMATLAGLTGCPSDPVVPTDAGYDSALQDGSLQDAGANDASADASGCPSGQRTCSGACVDQQSSIMHCGACDNACTGGANATAACNAGDCALTCSTNYANCDADDSNGCEVNSATDRMNCGACGTVCPGSQMCVDGACRLDCPNTICGSGAEMVCVDTASTIEHCGACGRTCTAPANGTAACEGSMCAIGACTEGYDDCDGELANGCETALNTVANCGGCGIACTVANASPVCTETGCGIGACDAGYADCDGMAANGCEAALNSDTANCGSCGGACVGLANAAPFCSMATCGLGSCAAGYQNCDGLSETGCEVSLNSDVTNCGTCGNACATPANGAAACVEGGCGIGSCNDGFADCDNASGNGCEGSLMDDESNCGACGRACGEGEYCRSGTCQWEPGPFTLPTLAATGCNAIEHVAQTSDDRGGIAVSSTHVFYTGDNATGRFSRTDLSGAASVGAQYDRIFSDLATEQVYTLRNAAGNVGIFQGMTLDRIVPIDGSTGALGAPIMLSTPIANNGNTRNGIFSGRNRVLVLTNNRLYDIWLPSGQVRDLGAMTTTDMAQCESDTVYGVAEATDSTVSITYVQLGAYPYRNIVRQQVWPTIGTPSIVTTFTNLGDMCSFTVSTSARRWYFHHEGPSQFRTGDETVGYCDASPAP